VTGLLCLIGLLGFFGLTEVWRADLAPDIERSVSGAAFRVIDQAVTHVLESQELFWVTAGAAIAIWQFSGVVRADGQTLNRVYEVEEERPLLAELSRSIATGTAVALLLLAALAIVRLGPLALEDVFGDSGAIAILGFVLRWALAGALLFVIVGLIARAGPDIERPVRWISFGSGLTVAGWVVTTLVFGLYLSQFASFGSVYGALLATFLLVEYLYLAGIVFLGGLVIDRLAQAASGTREPSPGALD